MTNHLSFQQKHKQLLHIFQEDFFQVYQQLDKAVQKDILKIAPVLFRRWYVSSIIPETTLSPSVAFRIDFAQQLSAQKVYSYVMEVNTNQQKEDIFQYHLLEYSLEKHLLIEDLQTVLDYCTPDCTVTEDGMFFEKDIAILLKKLSHKDIFYVQYITMLLWNLELLAPIASIHTYHIQPSKKAENFFQKPHKEILPLIIEAALEIASYEFTQVIGTDSEYFTPDVFREFLKSGMDIENIFISFYDMVEIDITKIWEMTPEEMLSEDDTSIVSSFFFMGVLLDKWFLTPFSHFLQLIYPIYYLPIYFINLLNRMANLIVAHYPIHAELYGPCSTFDLTPLGETLLGERGKKQPLPVQLSFPEVLEGISHHWKKHLLENILSEQDPSLLVCPILISSVKHPEQWKIIELLDTSSLFTLCSEVCSTFDFINISEYSVTREHINSFPIFKGSLFQHKKEKPYPFLSVSFFPGDILFFTPEKDISRQLKIEFLPKQKQIPFILYPRLRKQSNAIEKFDDLY